MPKATVRANARTLPEANRDAAIIERVNRRYNQPGLREMGLKILADKQMPMPSATKSANDAALPEATKADPTAKAAKPDLTPSINERFGQIENPLTEARTWVSLLEKVVESMADLPRFSKRDLTILCEEFIRVSEPLKEAVDAMDAIYHGRAEEEARQ